MTEESKSQRPKPAQDRLDERMREMLTAGLDPDDVAMELCDERHAAGELSADEIELAHHEWTSRARHLQAAEKLPAARRVYRPS